tara:strand:- start:30 stop:824 length:795 start_codon:yes stop_codon:yes gene_type:complete
MSVLDQLSAFNKSFRGDPEQRSKPIRQTGGDASVMEEVMSRPVADNTTNLFQGASLAGGAGQGSAATSFANPGGMPGATKAQQILGDNYGRFLALGVTPSEIDRQLERALAFGRGIDVGKIEDQLDKFEQFNRSKFNETGIAPLIGGQNFLSVSKPEIVANEPEGLLGLIGAIGGPFIDMIGDVAKAGAEGRVGAMNIFNELRDKVGDFTTNLNQPGTLGFRIRALNNEQRRFYDDLIMNQGVSPFRAIEQAEKRATGGIATLQ